jgi:hypothetical protein
MEILIKFNDTDILVLPLEGKVLGPTEKTGTRKEIYRRKDQKGYCRRSHKEPKILNTSARNRLIWSAVNGPIPEGMQINHINHDRADDRITNLELATFQQNSWYKQKNKYKVQTGKFIGVIEYGTKYLAQISINGKLTRLGIFKTEKQAALAYDKAALAHRGKFAGLNFPDKHKKRRNTAS